MEQKHKVLLQDLCARLPYGVKVRSKIPINQNETKEIVGQVTSVHYNIDIVQVEGFDVIVGYSPYFEIKPYLFPLSSMTKGQMEELNKKFSVQLLENDIYLHYHSQGCWDTDVELDLQDWLWFINWCYKHHFDINNLIEKSLALDATGLNIY